MQLAENQFDDCMLELEESWSKLCSLRIHNQLDIVLVEQAKSIFCEGMPTDAIMLILVCNKCDNQLKDG